MDKNRIFRFSLEIKELLKKQNTAEATEKIQQADLTEEEFKFLEECLRSDGYNPTTGKFQHNFSDNSEFLKLVSLVTASVKAKK